MFENVYVLWGSSFVKFSHQTWILILILCMFFFFVSFHCFGNDITSRLSRYSANYLVFVCALGQ